MAAGLLAVLSDQHEDLFHRENVLVVGIDPRPQATRPES